MEDKVDILQAFKDYSIMELRDLLDKAIDRESRLFYQKLLDLKMGLAQEKVVGKALL